jgi:hypothetical protein
MIKETAKKSEVPVEKISEVIKLESLIKLASQNTKSESKEDNLETQIKKPSTIKFGFKPLTKDTSDNKENKSGSLSTVPSFNMKKSKI